jgi:8-oxo-dGTP pyrophosphatase MutT (NUDIX family)
MESGKLAKSKKKVASADSQIKGLLYADPAPTPGNVQAALQNADALSAKLLSMREELQRGSRLTVSSDGTRVMSGLQKYISKYRREMAAHKSLDGVDAPIEVPDDFAFGFEKYLTETNISEDAVVVPQLDKQRQVLSYILNQLIAADPAGIQAVEREVLEEAGKDVAVGFRINPAASARVPGAIDTLAFRVTFTGYTPTLRKFLNNLAEFNLPIVVRGVEVDRPTTNVKAAKTNKKASSSIDAIFSVFGGTSSAEATTTEVASTANKTPVISETESSFTVTLEFIEIVLPSNSEENPT